MLGDLKIKLWFNKDEKHQKGDSKAKRNEDNWGGRRLKRIRNDDFEKITFFLTKSLGQKNYNWLATQHLNRCQYQTGVRLKTHIQSYSATGTSELSGGRQDAPQPHQVYNRLCECIEAAANCCINLPKLRVLSTG